MKRQLFLSGPIGCGKSTLIKDALGGAAKSAGGFVTVRALDENDALIGFDLLPACSLACPERQCPAFRFISFSEAGVRRDSGVFRTEAVRLLNEAGNKPFAVLDEFGGYEMLVPEFTEALKRFLKSGVPCVGVLKTPEAVKALRSRISLPPGYPESAAGLRAALEADSDTEILGTSGRNDENAKAALRAWVEEFVHG
ncbi:MAG: hypothetical protein EOM54_09145 [Clostridia bacterium]|nr:hypothetical protein [Clostridia bacterium]